MSDFVTLNQTYATTQLLIMFTLYSFATSERPEAYVNALCYCVLHKRVTSFKVIVVKETNTDSFVRPAILYANIITLLTNLADATYSKDRLSPPISIGNISSGSFDIYRRVLDILNSSGDSGQMEITEANLDEKLEKIIFSGENIFAHGNSIIDVTSLKSKLLIDIVAISLSFHFSEIYAFNSFRRLTFDENDLFHKLKNQDFEFRNLTDGNFVKAMVRIRRWSARSRFLVILTIILLFIGLFITFFYPDSRLFYGFNLASMIASLCSYLFLFSKYGQ